MTILTFFALTAGRCCWPRRVFLETGKGDEYGGIDGLSLPCWLPWR